MEHFVEQYRTRVKGIVAGHDRVLFRGTLRSISHAGGLERFLSSIGVLYKEFHEFAERSTQSRACLGARAPAPARPGKLVKRTRIRTLWELLEPQ